MCDVHGGIQKVCGFLHFTVITFVFSAFSCFMNTKSFDVDREKSINGDPMKLWLLLSVDITCISPGDSRGGAALQPLVPFKFHAAAANFDAKIYCAYQIHRCRCRSFCSARRIAHSRSPSHSLVTRNQFPEPDGKCKSSIYCNRSCHVLH